MNQFPSALNPLKNLKTIWDFDVSYTLLPAGGFKDVDDYYNQSSSKHFLQGNQNTHYYFVCRMTILLFQVIYLIRLVMSEKVDFVSNQRSGGHMGYISRQTTSLMVIGAGWTMQCWNGFRELHESGGNP